MTSLQEPAPGSKSAKFVAANPLEPMVKPFESSGLSDDQEDGQNALAENVNRRLEKAMGELKEKHRTGRNEVDDPDRAPTGPAYQQQLANDRETERQRKRTEEEARRQESDRVHALRLQVQAQVQKNADDGSAGDNSDDGDSDYDYLLDEDADAGGDDPVLDAIRQRRLEELRRAQINRAENLARGHGQYRSIAQDEFLPECTGSSEYVAVHFFHREFQRCDIMDHHLKIVAPLHETCKFLRIDAEKAPFFVAKLQVRTLPALLVFHRGKEIERLTGFDDLIAPGSTDPDRWETSRLQEWLAASGAIEYSRPAATATPEELSREMERLGIRGRIYRGGSMAREYDDDDE